jgi:hypothetical protein
MKLADVRKALRKEQEARRRLMDACPVERNEWCPDDASAIEEDEDNHARFMQVAEPLGELFQQWLSALDGAQSAAIEAEKEAKKAVETAKRALGLRRRLRHALESFTDKKVADEALYYGLLSVIRKLAGGAETYGKVIEALEEEERQRMFSACNQARVNVRYKDGSSKEQHQAAWATGQYKTRDDCADKISDSPGGGSRQTIRNHLKGCPDPDPWPEKNA